jgi:C2 domain
MTGAQIDAEVMKPSTSWLEAGSGSLGKVYFELINVLDKTDAFACLAFEDCLVNTDVIGNSLSPRWMPWSRRAFVFNVVHPSSNMFMSVLDYDPPLAIGQLATRATSEVHDPIGRCLVNLSKLLPNTVYTLTVRSLARLLMSVSIAVANVLTLTTFLARIVSSLLRRTRGKSKVDSGNSNHSIALGVERHSQDDAQRNHALSS